MIMFLNTQQDKHIHTIHYTLSSSRNDGRARFSDLLE